MSRFLKLVPDLLTSSARLNRVTLTFITCWLACRVTGQAIHTVAAAGDIVPIEEEMNHNCCAAALHSRSCSKNRVVVELLIAHSRVNTSGIASCTPESRAGAAL